jgi:hypothetical protein
MLRITNYILQIFFIRLTKCSNTVVRDVRVWLIPSLVDKCDGQISHKETWYAIQGWVVPFTGWNTDFKYIGKRFFVKITKTKISG